MPSDRDGSDDGRPPPPPSSSSSRPPSSDDGGGGGRSRPESAQDRAERMQRLLTSHVSSYRVNLSFPASVRPSPPPAAADGGDDGGERAGAASADGSSAPPSSRPLRTKPELVNLRLAEAGVSLGGGSSSTTANEEGDDGEGGGGGEPAQTLGELTDALSKFVRGMERTGCYDAVRVVVGKKGEEDDDDDERRGGTTTTTTSERRPPPPRTDKLDVYLTEKNWYRLYAGGGLKHEGPQSESASGSTLPKVQFETSASLVNLTGSTDVSTVSYVVDQTSSSTVSAFHERPLYDLVPASYRGWALTRPWLNGTETSVRWRGSMDVADFEYTRSYGERRRGVGVRVSNVGRFEWPEAAEGAHTSLDWSLTFRDILPRRHPTIPYATDASPEIASQAGPSLLHSVKFEHRLNNSATDDRYNPTDGIDGRFTLEVAGPPGDVGYAKVAFGIDAHAPIVPLSPPSDGSGFASSSNLLGGASIHGSWNGGLVRPLSYGGLCPRSVSVSDKFFVGGPMQLRGFVPAGIGPRAATGGASTPGGDALGGDFYYTASILASIPFPAVPFLRNNNVRLFGFVNAGTLTDWNDGVRFRSVLSSTRCAAGGGVSVGTPMGRIEGTYAVPLRYGPRDARRSVQVGLGFSFG